MGTAAGEELITAFDKVRHILKAGYIEIAHSAGGIVDILGARSFEDGVEFLPFEAVAETPEYKKENSAIHEFTLTHKNKPLHCIALRVRGDFLTVLIESKTPMDPSTPLLAAYCHAYGDLALSLAPKSAAGDNPSNKELSNIRQIQAMLFPKFENIRGFDIGAAYFPSQLMSGNFIDMKELSDDLIQVSTCVVNGYDSTASFIGAAVRTLLQALSGSSVIPSALIETMNYRLAKLVAGIHYMVSVSIFQLNLKTGKVSISSLGPVSTLFYIANKKRAIDLGETQIGHELSKRAVFKDISFMLDPGDTLLYYSEGAVNAEKEDGSAVFGKQNLYDKFRVNIDQPSKEHVQTISQCIFEYIDYTPIRDDILLVRIKRSGA